MNPLGNTRIWKNLNVSNFTHSGRNCKADEFSASLSDDCCVWTVQASLDNGSQLSLTLRKCGDGFRLGNGGRTVFWSSAQSPDGSVMHSFWPRTDCQGTIVNDGKIIDAVGTGFFIHASQGMRPNLVAKAWNFASFHSPQRKLSAILMEFTTPEGYGMVSDTHPDKVRVGTKVLAGGITVDGKLAAVVGSHEFLGMENGKASLNGTSIEHVNPTLDPETGYAVPESVEYRWSGASIADKSKTVTAELTLQQGAPDKLHGLLEKVDVLAEVPYLLKKVVNVVAQTKPYIYQFLNQANIKVTLPSEEKPGETETISVEGTLYSENTFISA